MSKISVKQKEVDDNYAFFKTLSYEEVTRNIGRYALLKNQQVMGYFSTHKDAVTAGRMLSADGLFSIQKVGDSVRRFGFFSAIPKK